MKYRARAAALLATLGLLGIAPIATYVAPASAAPAAAWCRSNDFTLRYALRSAIDPARSTAVESFVLRNAGPACRLNGLVHVEFLGADGVPLAVRVAARTAMPLLLTVPAGGRTTFTVTLAATASAAVGCRRTARVRVTLNDDTSSVTTAAAFPICDAPPAAPIRISNMSLLPATPGSDAPAPTSP